jgi:glutamate-5-semialdehyde dehydrogenase
MAFDLSRICAGLRAGAETLALHTARQKNAALECVIQAIDSRRAQILDANRTDMAHAKEHGISDVMLNRLRLTDGRLDSVAQGLRTVIAEADPVGEVAAGWRLPNGLSIRQVRVPIGVAAVIYESRPAVTADAFALAYKSGNAVLLRGSSSAAQSNQAFAAAIHEGLERAGSDGVPDAFALADSGDRVEVSAILNARGLIDVAIPRGSASLIKMVAENARVPVIETGSGVCHLYVDSGADTDMAVNIAENGKLQNPSVCNALETLVVHRDVAGEFLPKLEARFGGRAQFRCDEAAFPVMRSACESRGGDASRVVRAAEGDFGFEFLDNIASVKTVSGIEEAIAFINVHGTKHSECIVTKSLEHTARFQRRVDAACVYVNASTRFTDGGEFGFGAEIGISTQKLHARGPMGLSALTTTKYLIDGEGQTRP